MKYEIFNQYTMFEAMQKTLQESESRLNEMIYSFVMDKLKESYERNEFSIKIRHFMFEEKKITEVFADNGNIQLQTDKNEVISFYRLTVKQKAILSYLI